MDKFKRNYFLLLVIFLPLQLLAQDVKVKGGFLEDSLVVGDKISFYLSVSYPKKQFLLFPDSTWNFNGFEFVEKKYFPTITKNDISTDSAVYVLTSFEIDSIQTLQIPVYQINTFDSTFYYSQTDSIFLKELVTQTLPDTLQAQNLPLKTNTTYQPVNWLLNYQLLAFIACILFLAGVFIWVFFGKKISERFITKRLLRIHQEFIQKYNAIENELLQNFSVKKAEQLITHWKKYLENLESKPYTKLTVKELKLIHTNEELIRHLKSFDAAVYGNKQEVIEDSQYLKQYAELTFQEKLKAFTHEK